MAALWGNDTHIYWATAGTIFRYLKSDLSYIGENTQLATVNALWGNSTHIFSVNNSGGFYK